MSHILVNFNIPYHLKKNFDQLSKFKRVSKTSILNSMIEEFCRTELRLIKEDGLLDDFMTDMQNRKLDQSRQMVSNRDFSTREPFNIILTNNHYDLDDGPRL